MSTDKTIDFPAYCDENLRVFRNSVDKFVERECLPYVDQWRAERQVPRDVWLKAGDAGLLMASAPEEYGGGGADFSYDATIIESFGRYGAHQFVVWVSSAVFGPYLVGLATEAQKREWIPKLASGEWIGAIAMSEPNTGSDLRGIQTTAVRDGDSYVINGQKTFTTLGHIADLFMVACKTANSEGGEGLSLFFVQADMPGFSRGRKLDKIGLEAQATSELFFDNVRVPADHLLGGEEGQGFDQMKENLSQERLIVAIDSIAMIERAILETTAYVKERKAFGKPLLDFQNTQFVLADCSAKAAGARTFVDDCVRRLTEDNLDAVTAAKAKYWLSELQGEVVDKCLQLFGGYGYINEYPIAGMYRDARVSRIYGGTNEIMKLIIARDL